MDLLEPQDTWTRPGRRFRRHRRGEVKTVLLTILEEAGADGVNARSVVDAAAVRNVYLSRTTISSLLSRLKADGVVAHDGYRYRIARKS